MLDENGNQIARDSIEYLVYDLLPWTKKHSGSVVHLRRDDLERIWNLYVERDTLREKCRQLEQELENATTSHP